MAQDFEQTNRDGLDVFGPGWNGEKISWCPIYWRRCYSGWKPDKVDYNLERVGYGKRKKLGYYKFVIASENYAGSQGYISEKIFDALLGGSVPVYLGEKSITDSVPGSCFINARQFHSLEHLVKKLERMSEKEWQQIRFAGKAFLNSKAFQEFTNDKYTNQMSEIIKEII